jgi:hypothetical protein
VSLVAALNSEKRVDDVAKFENVSVITKASKFKSMLSLPYPGFLAREK